MNARKRAPLPPTHPLRPNPTRLDWCAAAVGGATGVAYLVTDGRILDGPGGALFFAGLVVGGLYYGARGLTGEAAAPAPQGMLQVVAGRNQPAPTPALTCENEGFDATVRRPAELGAES